MEVIATYTSQMDVEGAQGIAAVSKSKTAVRVELFIVEHGEGRTQILTETRRNCSSDEWAYKIAEGFVEGWELI